MLPVRCRVDHTANGGESFELRRPAGVLETRDGADVFTVLGEAEAAARRGFHVAGLVSYEAAAAFDPAFRVRSASSSGPPLVWFGLFSEAAPAAELPSVPCGPDTGPWVGDTDRAAHASAVGAIRGVAARGDAYLVNYTTRFRRPWSSTDDPLALYCRLVASYGRGYHAYIETDEWAVACGSPELFFERSADRVVTRPMKGTAPRGRWSEEDEDRGRALYNSPKERAENVMVVDLLRNDLGRIAVCGSVAVPALYETARHPTVWQMTSTVTAAARQDVGLADLFGAVFPCASVTGAPKVAAMSVIADLEASRRGVYCGAVGVLTPGQESTARFAVAIRTAVVDKVGGIVEYGSGGGITWDSCPDLEWEEVLLKVGPLLSTKPVVSLGADGGLIETMAFVPDREGGEVRNLADHLARLVSSARYFGITVPDGIDESVAKAVAGLEHPTRVRLLLGVNGTVVVETSALEVATCARPLWLCLDDEPIDSSDATLFHKTTDRGRYDVRARRHRAADDVVLVNQLGQVTETTRANLAVCLDGQWCTPSLECGLLPGIERARWIADGRLVERVITRAELVDARAVATLSSLRSWRAARVLSRCRC